MSLRARACGASSAGKCHEFGAAFAPVENRRNRIVYVFASAAKATRLVLVSAIANSVRLRGACDVLRGSATRALALMLNAPSSLPEVNPTCPQDLLFAATTDDAPNAAIIVAKPNPNNPRPNFIASPYPVERQAYPLVRPLKSPAQC